MYFFRQEFEFVIGEYEIKSTEDKKTVPITSGKICPDYQIYSKDNTSKYPEINLYYGPYECNGIIKHRPQKLHGLIECLENMSYNVQIIPIGNLNLLEVVSMGYLIHTFDLRYLKFNMRYEDDKTCIRVLNVISEAIDRLYGENNYTIKKPPQERLARGTTISISSKLSFSYYDHLLKVTDY